MKDNNATLDEGVLDLETEVALYEENEAQDEEVVLSPREVAMQNIIDNRKKTLEDEGVVLEDEVVEDVPVDTFYKVKVDGEELEVSYENLVKSYQKDATASKRLEEAAKLQKSLDERAKLLADQEAELNSRKEKTTIQDAVDAATHDDGKTFDLAQFTKQIREGDDEDAIEAVRGLYENLTKAQRNAMNPDTVAKIVLDTVSKRDEAKQAELAKEKARKQQAEADAAEEVFLDEYKNELKSNDRFYDMAIVEATYLLKDEAWDDKSFEERFREAGRRAKSLLNPGIMSSKRIIKKQLKHTPSVTVKSNIGTDAPARQTPSDIIQKMKLARGQMV